MHLPPEKPVNWYCAREAAHTAGRNLSRRCCLTSLAQVSLFAFTNKPKNAFPLSTEIVSSLLSRIYSLPGVKFLGSSTKIGVVWQKTDFWTKNRNFGPKKRGPLFIISHVLATTGKSCSKKKSAFAQIIKGGNVILGDFLG